MAQHERRLGRRYDWVLRLRTDLMGAPATLPHAAAWRGDINGAPGVCLGTPKVRSDRVTIPNDQYALLTRAHAAAYMNVSSAFGECQSRRDNARLCGETWRWPTQECIVARWLVRCGLPRLDALLCWVPGVEARA